MPYKHQKILILGDAGRGKSSFAGKLSQMTGIQHYSTDDFFWKVKFTEPNDKAESVKEISKIYMTGSWIVEGTTRRLIKEGLEKSDVIYLLKFKNIFFQYLALIKRKFGRKYESFIDLWKLLKHVTFKKYKKNYSSDLPLETMIEPYKNKIIELSSYKEISNFLSTNF